ncbi:MAG: DUF4167 domain-containing protein [Rhodospirillaceae bacterium]|nr:DUF4167 domain-containing protein [Rhodospirillaceae bacterium]
MRQGTTSRRSRGRGQRKPHMPMKQQMFDSAGPDIRVRGNAYQVWEKYLALARDAQSAGDRIAAENFLQHAEHYYRIMNANGADPATYNGRPRYQHPRQDDGFDEEQPGGQPVHERQADMRQGDGRPRDARPRPQPDGGQPQTDTTGGNGEEPPTGTAGG